MHKVIYFAVCVLFIAAAGCKGNGGSLSKLGPQDTVLAFGDSLTYGVGASVAESYPSVLSSIIGRNVVRSGVSGETTSRGLKRLPEELRKHRPKILLLCHGGNDILKRRSLKKAAGNLVSMIAMARKQGVEVVLIGVPRFQISLGGASPAEFYDRVAEQTKVVYLPEALPELIYDNKYKSDSIHLNAAGYRKLAEAVAELFEDAGAT